MHNVLSKELSTSASISSGFLCRYTDKRVIVIGKKRKEKEILLLIVLRIWQRLVLFFFLQVRDH